MKRMQMLIRPWGTAREMENSSWRSEGRNALHESLHMGIVMGILEVPETVDADDLIRPLALDLRGNKLCLGEAELCGEKWERAELKQSEIRNWLTQQVWRGPAQALADAAGYGQIITRDTLLPASDGHKAVVFCGIAFFSDEPSTTLFDAISLNGTDFIFASAASEPMIVPMGNSVIRELELPQWGWGLDPVGLRSTLLLDVQHASVRIDELRMASLYGELSDPEHKELRELDLMTGGLGRGLIDDKNYREFRRVIHDAGFVWPPITEMMTAARLRESSALANAAVRAVSGGLSPEDAAASLRATMAERGIYPAETAMAAPSMGR